MSPPRTALTPRRLTAPSPLTSVVEFLELAFELVARLVGAQGEHVKREIDHGLEKLCALFRVDQCAILEIDRDQQKILVRHLVQGANVAVMPKPALDPKLFPWIYAKVFERGETLALRRIDDLPPEAASDRRWMAATNLRSILDLPIANAGQVTHVLRLGCERQGYERFEQYVPHLRILARAFVNALARSSVERTLQHSQRQLADAERIGQVGSWAWDIVTDKLTTSEQGYRILGLRPEDIPTTTDYFRYVHADDRIRYEEAVARTLREQIVSFDMEYRVIQPSGEMRVIHDRGENSYAANGVPLGATGTIQDVTQLRAAERELRRLQGELWRADRAARAGALTGSLAHELNQPLTAILSSAQAGLRFLDRDVVNTTDLRTLLEAVVSEDKRAVAVIRGVCAMFRREEMPRARIDLAEALQEALALVRSELDAQQVRVELDFEAGCVILADKTQIQQVAINLIMNSLEALQARSFAERRLRVSVTRIGGQEVRITVTDSGVGIPDDKLESVFAPLETTKAHGMGMGLAICKAIVELHGGEIHVVRNQDCGVTVRIVLPAESPKPAFQPILSTPEPVQERKLNVTTGVVCVVDDDSSVRRGLETLLASAGFSVEIFASAQAFLDSAAESGAECLVLDVRMAGMSGPNLYQRLRQTGASLPVVFLTGYGDVLTGIEAIKNGAFDFLLKPVDDTILLESVGTAIERYRIERAREREYRGVQERLERLSAREREVMERVIRGRLNKQIAAELGISEKTVKQHRGCVMDKMAIGSVAELVRLCESVGVGSSPSIPCGAPPSRVPPH